MVLSLAPAYSSDLYSGSSEVVAASAMDARPLTAFQSYLLNKQQDRGAQAPRRAASTEPVQQEQPAHCHASTGVAACLQHTGRATPTRGGWRPSSQSSGPKKEYGCLADAATSLAAAARSLAAGPVRPAPISDALQASCGALAAAAAELALNVTKSTAPARTPSPVRQPAASQPAFAAQPKLSAVAQADASRGPVQTSQASLPPVTPQSQANHTQHLPAPFASTSGRSVVGQGRTSTPKFTPLNPLLALASDLPPRPLTTASRPTVAGNPASRPVTANPITHALQEPTTPYTPSLGPSHPHTSTSRSATPGPGDKGSTVAQVLAISPDGASAAAPPACTGEPQNNPAAQPSIDPVQLYLTNPDMVRIDRWPPPTPITLEQLSEDLMARHVNAVLGSLKERIASTGAQAVVRCFKLADTDCSGQLDADEFKSVLLSLNLKTMSGVDPTSVMNLLMEGLDKNHDGRINYLEFVSAVKFNKLPYAAYNPKFRHKVGGDPEQPFGAPTVNFPFGTVKDGDANNAASRSKLERTFQELRNAFQTMDSDQDGVVTRSEFMAALDRLDRDHRLSLGSDYIARLYRDTDIDYSGGVDYEAFLSAFTGSTQSRFVPDFLLPQSLRGSQLGAPWEWRTGPQPGQRRTGALPPPMTAATSKDSLKATTSRPSIRVFQRGEGPPATPLVLPGSRLLRSLQA